VNRTVAADILVTGAGGFLGRALVRRLRADQHAVRVLVRRVPEWAAADAGVDGVLGDLGDSDAVDRAVAGMRVVYHVGATTRGTPDDFRSGTIAGTQHVIDACLRHSVRRLVYVSSLGVLAPPERGAARPIAEDAPVDPHPERRGAYTHAKIVAEQLVRAAVATRGLPAVIVRPGQIGARRRTGRPTPRSVSVRSGWRWDRRRSRCRWSTSTMCGRAVLAANRPGIEGRTFHVIDPTPVTHGQYLEHCRRRVGAGLRIVRVPAGLLGTAAHVAEGIGRLTGRDMPLTRYRVRALQPHAAFDLTAATTVLEWQPRVGITNGLRATFG
jgi:nucleoside-diphosphate-sugar epimerase